MDIAKWRGYAIEPPYKELRDQLEVTKSFVTSFQFVGASSSCYYIFPLVYMLPNLTTLTLIDCTISMYDFFRLYNSLTKIKYITLNTVTFASLPSEYVISKDLAFPKSLKSLIMDSCLQICTELLSDPFDFLFDLTYEVDHNDFILPKISSPSLKKLRFRSLYFDDNGLNEFLESNPQIEELALKSTHLDQFKLDLFSNSNSLKRLDIDCEIAFPQDIIIPKINSITHLDFNHTNLYYYPIMKDLCINCINLDQLGFLITTSSDFSETLNIIITQLIPNAFKLKYLSITILGEYNEIIDLKKLKNIESITIYAELSAIECININFDSELKKIGLYSYSGDFNIIEIEKNYSFVNNWEFKITENSINGYKID